jgi:hypothetical protein
MEPDTQEPQHNISYEAVIVDHTSETGSIAPGSGHHVEEPVPTFVEILAYFVNPPFTDPLGQPLFDPPSMRYIDSFSSYYLPPGSTTTPSFGMNPPIFGFPEGLGNSYFSTTPVVDTVGAYSLLETSVTQVTLTQPLTHSSPLAHESGNIPASFFPHMHMPSALLGRPIGQMANSQVIHTTMVTQATQPPSHTSQISTPYIGGQSSMGGQPSTGGKPSVAGKLFTRGKPTWLQHQQAWGKTTPASPSIPTTTGLYPASISRSCESFVDSTQSDGHSSARNYALSICKPHDSNTIVPSTTIHRGTNRSTTVCRRSICSITVHGWTNRTTTLHRWTTQTTTLYGRTI